MGSHGRAYLDAFSFPDDMRTILAGTLETSRTRFVGTSAAGLAPGGVGSRKWSWDDLEISSNDDRPPTLDFRIIRISSYIMCVSLDTGVV